VNIKYVVFYEMVHLIVKKHNKDFWFYIKKEFKNPEKYEEKLFLIVKKHNKDFWFYIKKEFKNPEKYEEKLFGYWFLITSIFDVN